MKFLYDRLVEEFGNRAIKSTPIPTSITDNLKPAFKQRPYQTEAFQRFILCYTEDFAGKPKKPLHLLFNMATGSGKTLVMAGNILYLYEKGYRNFLFFVNSNNIIKKTKDNFLNQYASKYLFNEKIIINGKAVRIKEVNTFAGIDNENINIKFTTIQQLHIDLNTAKENSITYEDFKDKKIVLIADEAHHLSSGTKKKGELSGSWEGTVLEILQQNYDNILLEYTATLDYDSREILNKYYEKVLFKYDLAQFRIDKYSKEINLIRSYYDEQERILQALILNLYRQELAALNNINLKPVILFKAKKTIKESEQNKLNFHILIEDLSETYIDKIKNTATVPIVQKAFTFFNAQNISSSDIANRIKFNFRDENCISANNDEEAERNQLLLNTLEDENNPIRAVFAVQKLNEGWDVLNLFDIVRLYEGQNTGGTNKTIGSTTLSEAQLIGRGARYFPFTLVQGQDRFSRKYDDDVKNDLKILEELYYHTKEDSRYISELKKALVESGIYQDEDKLVTKHLKIKTEFKHTEFYKKGRVFFNKKIEKSYNNVNSFSDLGVSLHNYNFELSSGIGRMTGVFNDEQETLISEIESIDKKVADIPTHIIRYAIAQNSFFYYDSIRRYFPNVSSTSAFISSNDYLGKLEITITGPKSRLNSLTNFDLLQAVQGLLHAIEIEIKSNLIEFEGSGYINEYIHNVFRDKEIRVLKDSERENGQEDLVSKKDWYVYNANYGTSEEKSFVKMFSRRFESLKKKYKNIYLIRNEREVKIYDKSGRTFEPDYILFCQQQSDKEVIYQVFIQPKGAHLIASEKWKEGFLDEIRKEKKTIEIETDHYTITGVPFYNNEIENEFNNTFKRILDI